MAVVVRCMHDVPDVILQAKHSVGLMWWLLAREVLRLRGAISRDLPWDVMPDLYFYRDPEDVSLQ